MRQLYLTLSIICFVSSSLLQKVVMSDDGADPYAGAILFQLIPGILIACIAWQLDALHFPSWKIVMEHNLIWHILASTFFYGVGTIAKFAALKKGDLSSLNLIFSLNAFVAIARGSIFLGEVLSLRQRVGAVVIFLGLFVQSEKKIGWTSSVYAFFLAGLTAIFYGSGFANDKFMLDHMDILPLLVILFPLPAIMISLIRPKSLKGVWKICMNRKQIITYLLLTSIFAVDAIYFRKAIVAYDNISVIMAINQISVILIVLGGILFLNERENMRRKMLAALISTSGLLLLVI